jgi:hypothetical protein
MPDQTTKRSTPFGDHVPCPDCGMELSRYSARGYECGDCEIRYVVEDGALEAQDAC